MIHLLDAHAILWHIEDAPALGDGARRILNDPEAQLVVSSITLSEVRWALFKKRVADTWAQLLVTIAGDGLFDVYPVTLEIVSKQPIGLEMHDALICSTALVLAESTGDDVLVVTTDPQIRASGLVNTVW